MPIVPTMKFPAAAARQVMAATPIRADARSAAASTAVVPLAPATLAAPSPSSLPAAPASVRSASKLARFCANVAASAL